MKFFQENPFLSGLIGVAVLIFGGGGFFVIQAMDQANLAREDYDGKVRQLHTLQNSVPYPSQENLTKVEQGTAVVRKSLQDLRDEVSKLQPGPAEDVTPQAFQDDLRKAVIRIEAKADEFGVSLGDDFYLGFNRYQAALPRSEATGELVRQLAVMEDLFTRLIETRVASIGLQRQDLPIEDGAPAKDNAPLISRENINLTLAGDQGRVRLAINVLLDLPQFAVIRAVSLANSQPVGPVRETDAAALTQTAEGSTPVADQSLASLFGGQGEATASTPQSLPIVLGRELITANIRLELLDFRGFKIEGQ